MDCKIKMIQCDTQIYQISAWNIIYENLLFFRYKLAIVFVKHFATPDKFEMQMGYPFGQLINISVAFVRCHI